MNKKIPFLILILLVFTCARSQQLPLKKGMKIHRSVIIKKGLYQLDAYDSLENAIIVIEGNNIVVDFNNAVLKGSNHTKRPDEFQGLAVMIRNGKNITIKNLEARGYKIALMATNVDGLKIENCNFSYNYRQHLNSTQEKENISDWMSYHQNEKDEWMRYGAAMYLKGCRNFIISHTKVTGGQNALMMTRCENGTVFNNDFSFNSGIGIGMYRSVNNRVMYNRINFNVRGYSHGVYNRGQDSAGILVYEQSSGNLFYNNSATHSGDGFFLWAGQTTMNTGEGGCNDNRIIDNDFSYAPTNGIEVTFSRNEITGNRIFECDHGIWGGYSYQTTIKDNQFRNNRIAIAIEHGRQNRIESNIFYKDREAIRLWARPQQPPDWGYAKYMDTRSAGYLIALNSFNQNPLVYHFSRTDSMQIFNNRYAGVEQVFKIDSTVGYIDSTERDLFDTLDLNYSIPNAIDPFKGNSKLAGRKNIMMTEWGPYDFNYPLIWNFNPADTTAIMQFNVLGPPGQWKIISVKGLDTVSKYRDSLPSTFTALRRKEERTDIEIQMEYTGVSFTDAFGNSIPAQKPRRFSFRKFFQPINFTVEWYAFDSTNNPVATNNIESFKAKKPFKIDTVNQLQFAWWGGIKSADTVYRQFLTVAEGSAELLPGEYELGLTWDDAARLYIDGKLVLDEWNPGQYKFDESPHKKLRLQLGGRHSFRVEHAELGGFASLSLGLKKIQ